MTNLRFGLGIPDPAALLSALNLPVRDVRQVRMNALQRGTPPRRPLVNPQAGTPQSFGATALPDDTDPRTAVDLACIGALALLRDVPLAEINGHPVAVRLANTLATLPTEWTAPYWFGGTDGLFRINAATRGDRIGALVRQPIPLGFNSEASFRVRQRLGSYITTQDQWEALQSAVPVGGTLPPQQFGPVREVSTGRDIASLVHQDWPVQIPELVACQLLWANAARSTRFPALPNEAGFISYGGAHDLICSINATRTGAELAWWTKFGQQQRARPHELWRLAVAGRLHPVFLQAFGWIAEQVGQFLPMIYAEGSPLHSDNPSGHAYFAGFGFTILLASFADASIQSLGVTNLHHELRVMAWHMAVGRSWAGIHTLGSLAAGLQFGEDQALIHLANQSRLSRQRLFATSFVGVSGKTLTVPGSC